MGMLKTDTSWLGPSLFEVCWTEPEACCLLHGAHCWHVRLVTALGPTPIVNGVRCCCWCGLRQRSRDEQDPEPHGPFVPAASSLLDLMIESAQRP